MRGEIVYEEALIELLETPAIADTVSTFAHESAVGPRLRALDNVVLLTHMASAAIKGQIAMGEKGDY